MCDAVAEDVHVLVGVPQRADLDRRNDPHAMVGPGAQRLSDAGDRVVVGQREQLDAGLCGCGDDVGWVEDAIRARRVRLEVEGGAGIEHRPRSP